MVAFLRRIRWLLVAALFGAALALCLRFPSGQLLGSHLTPSLGDPLFNLYVVSWGAERIAGGLDGLWSPPFFYPAAGVLAFSDYLIGPALTLAAWLEISSNPVAGFNLIVFSSFVLCGLTATWVARQAGLRWPASLLVGALFAFAPYRWSRLHHPQMLLTQWIPLVLWGWHRLLTGARLRAVWWFLPAYALHLGGGTYLAYMIHIPLVIVTISTLPAMVREQRVLSSARRLAPVVVLCGCLAALAFAPYWRARDVASSRTEDEISWWGATIVSYLQPSELSLVHGDWVRPWWRAENELFSGFLATGCAVSGLLVLARRRRSASLPATGPRRIALAVSGAGVAGGFVLGEWRTWARTDLIDSLALRGWGGVGYRGPFLLMACSLIAWILLSRRSPGRDTGSQQPAWDRSLLLAGASCFALTFPIVYLQLRSLVPGLDGMRVSARFFPFVSFALAFFVGRAVDRLTQRLARRPARAGCWLAVLALLVVDSVPSGLSWHPVPTEKDLPRVYCWLTRQPNDGAVLEMPIDSDAAEIRRMWLSRFHRRPIVNGYSGHFPAAYWRLRSLTLPDRSTLDSLAAAGVRYLVLNRWLLDRAGVTQQEMGAWRRALQGSGAGVRVAYRDGEHLAIELTPAAPVVPGGRWTAVPPARCEPLRQAKPRLRSGRPRSKRPAAAEALAPFPKTR